MKNLEKRIKKLGLEEKAIQNKKIREEKEKVKSDWKKLSLDSKVQLTKEELISILDEIVK